MAGAGGVVKPNVEVPGDRGRAPQGADALGRPRRLPS